MTLEFRCVWVGFSPPSLHRTQFSANKLLGNISCKWIFGLCLGRIGLQSLGLSSVAAKGIIFFLFMAEQCSTVYIHHISFIRSSVDGCLHCFPVLVAALSMHLFE